ncbi:hypothetical protein [Streptacidiphilus sp. EB103A]|uniref:hypothetical protein n=1 Tax=Streptacidiphilus sp. EB103A TaxID=3156275 RepID=UPI003519A686
MKLRSGWQMVYVALLMLLNYRLQQHNSGLWWLFAAPNILLCSEMGSGGEVGIKSFLTVVAVCFVASSIHLHF